MSSPPFRRESRHSEVGVQHVFFEMNIPAQPPFSVMLETMERLAKEVLPTLRGS